MSDIPYYYDENFMKKNIDYVLSGSYYLMCILVRIPFAHNQPCIMILEGAGSTLLILKY